MLAGLYVGTCKAGELGVRIVELNALILPDGEPQGSTDAISVRRAFTFVDRPFNDLLVDDQVVVVFDEANPETVAACGSIGGVLDAQGELAIGLTPVGESGTVGIAYLSPENDGSATGISIFVMQQPVTVEGTPAP